MSADAARQKTFVRAPTPPVAVRPVAVAVPLGVQRQTEPRVSSRADPAEREAEDTARRVVRSAPQPPHLARFSQAVALIQKRAAARTGPAVAPPGVAAAIASSRGGGSPLPENVRGFMSARFNADFSRVRVHTGETAARLAQQLGAQAFTYGSDIFFARGRFNPDSPDGRELIAHELTHTIQQGAAPAGRPALQRSEDVSVRERSEPQVQRFGIGDVLDYFADRANNIPGFRMFTIVLGVNPINMSRVERSAANILRAVVELLPGGGLITRALDEYGVFERVGTWVEEQIRSLGIAGGLIRDAIDRFLDSLSWRDIFDLGDVWSRAVRIFSEPIDRILSFGRNLIAGILRFVRDAILRPLAGLASRTRAWDLLCAVLGRNPITGDPVPRNAETLIGGFMRLIGQEEIWQNIQRGNAIGRAWAWFQTALGDLVGFVAQLPSVFLDALRSLDIADLVLLPRAFARVASVFGSFIGRFVSWAGNTIWNLLEIVFSVVAPGVLTYLQRARAAFRSILRDPIRFVANLVRAGVQGMRQFAGNFLAHLRTALIGWLTGALSGANIYIPQAFNPGELVKFALSVLGLTWQNVRQKLVRAISEPAVRVLERSFELVQVLVTQGPAAAWERIVESITNLRDLVIEQVMAFVRDRIITAAVTRLVSLLNPAGAFIQAIIAAYNTIMFFVERMRQLVDFVRSAIDAIHPISIGDVRGAAAAMERGLVQGLTLVISFLARLVGLGRVSDAVTQVINRIREPIDRALDRVVEWVIAQARRLGRFVAQAGVPADPQQRLQLGLRAAVAVANRFAGRRVGAAVLEPLLALVRARYGFTRLELYQQRGRWGVHGVINPEGRETSDALTGEGAAEPLDVQLEPRGTPDVYEVLSPPGIRGAFAPPTAALGGQTYEVGYVGNVPAFAEPGTVARVAGRYRDEAFSSPEESARRFGLVLGLNRFADMKKKNRDIVAAAVRESGSWQGFPLGVFGFLWKPKWKLDGKSITFREAEREYPNREASMDRQEGELMRHYREKRAYPYGAFREAVVQHPFTRSLTQQMQERAARVFLHTGDPDAVSLRAQALTRSVTDPNRFTPAFKQVAMGLFNRYDRILRELGEDAVVVSGGYQMSVRVRVDAADVGINELATLLASMLDMEVRRKMSELDPRTVYFPEPNTLFRVTSQANARTPSVLQGSFGKSSGEGRAIVDSMIRAKNDNQVFRLVEAPLTTDPARFEVKIEDVEVMGPLNRQLTRLQINPRSIKKIIQDQSQSHASAHGWAEGVGHPHGITRHAGEAFKALFAIRNHYYAPLRRILEVSDRGLNEIITKSGTLKVDRSTGGYLATEAQAQAALRAAFSAARQQIAGLATTDIAGRFVEHFADRPGAGSAAERATQFHDSANALAKAAISAIVDFIQAQVLA